MKYKYLYGRSIMPDGIKSIKLSCYECGKPQARSYYTECGKYICPSCREKDEEGLLEGEPYDK